VNYSCQDVGKAFGYSNNSNKCNVQIHPVDQFTKCVASKNSQSNSHQQFKDIPVFIVPHK
jgi:hypothetical protein